MLNKWWQTETESAATTDMHKLKGSCISCRQCPIGGVKVDGENISNVFSNMNLKSKIMVIGQNPGLDEVKQKEPFMGMSGKIFVGMLEKHGLSRAMFYFSNIVKCHTIENRQPERDEIHNCQPFLQSEIDLVNPYLIVTLGSTALFQITGLTGISKYSGQLIISERYQIPVLPLFHPSPLNTNRNNNGDKLEDGVKYLKQIMDKVPAEITNYINSTKSIVECKWCSKLSKLDYCCDECKECHEEYIRDTNLYERKYPWPTK